MARPDKHRLYELAVTDGPRLARFLEAVHGAGASVLREDFSGTAALARAWAAISPRHRAIAVDADPTVLARIRSRRVRRVASDAARARDRADVIAATNFPIMYWHDRASLLRYLRRARESLNPRGVFVCDLYGGSDALRPRTQSRAIRDGRWRFTYVWRQKRADAATGLVENTISFRVPTERGVVQLRDAFVYRWRLWSIPELRDAMLEAGFASVDVHDRLGGAIDQDGRLVVRPLARGEPLDENWVVYVVARR